MRTPEFKRDGDALIWTFTDYQVAIGFDLLRETSEGLLGEVNVQGSQDIQPGKPAHYHWAKFNLSSTRARAELAKALGSRNSELDWSALLEYSCVKTAELWRQGEPVIDLSLGPEPDDDPYLVSKFLPDGETSVLFADGGSGKSLIALAVGLIVRTGGYLPGGLQPSRLGNVLYLDWETTHAKVKKRLHWLAGGLGIPTPSILYRAMYRPLADDIAPIRHLVMRYAVELVIVDSIGPACGGEPESAEVILRIFNAMRSLSPATRLVISHVSRAGAEQKNGAARPFGSAFVQNMARSVWEARAADQGDRRGVLDVALFARKSNDDEPQAPLGFHITYDKEAHKIRFFNQDVSEENGLAAHGSLSFRIRQTLKRGAKDTKTLAGDLDVTETTVRRTLQRMNDVQKISTGAGGRGMVATWGLSLNGVASEDDGLFH